MGGPFIIGVGGGGSSSGKTTIASALIRALSGRLNASEVQINEHASFLKLSAKKRWGAIKYTKTEFYSSIIDDAEILNEPNKDTQRLIEAGAQVVLWVQSPPENLSEVMPLALDRLYHLDGIIIEGNSAIEFVNPDVIVFASTGGNKDIKQSSWSLLNKAKIVIMSSDSPLFTVYPNILLNCKVFDTWNFNKNNDNDIIIKEVIDYMETLMNEKKAKELIIERSVEQRISCAEARKIAEETGLPYSSVGKLADDLRIKISNCELGCF